MIVAAGILFLTADKQALFLKRGPGGDHPGEWCFPGGQLEGEETLEACAVREAIEECGSIPAADLRGPRAMIARQIACKEVAGRVQPVDQALPPGYAEGVASTPPSDAIVLPGEKADFTTFLQRVKEPFSVALSEEHTAFAWAPVGEAPEPLHPGCRVALARLTMDELGIARAMAAGELTSPQRYENVTLFALRITGTGAAYRSGAKEYVWRDPSIYLNQEFLDRCNGLSVIFEHPKGTTLTSKEFATRNIGSILLPYIKGDEVWGIAKIYDDAAIKLMTEEQLSTSPAVVLRDSDDNTSVKLETGETLLIEGKPKLLDHVAVCRLGVWDKGGEPAGVLTEPIGEVKMTPEEMKAAEESRAKADAEAGEKLDKLLSGIDSVSKRLDSIEAKADAAHSRMDAMEEEESEEKKAADKAKRDAEEEAEKKAAAEKAEADKKADSVNIEERVRAELDKRLPARLSDEDHRKLADAQAKADSVFQAFGDAAPRPLDGESLLAYRRRVATTLKSHSPAWKPVDLAAIADSVAFEVAEGQIYKDAREAARNPVDLGDNELREIVRVDSATGTRKIDFVGKHSFVRGFKAPTTARVTKFLTSGRERS